MVMNDEKSMWLQIMDDIMTRGKLCSPRGKRVIEVEDYMFVANPLNRFANFRERNLNLRYMVGEFIWYLDGNPNNTMIEHYSRFWTRLRSGITPYFNSNYGFYIFKQGQLDHCLKQLVIDKSTRQAVIILANRANMMGADLDKVCTYSISFRIRDNKLNMSVNMRSNDLVRGLMIDFFQFSVIMEMLYVRLRSYYPDLALGTYTHKADSMHVYQEHWNMVRLILDTQGASYTPVYCPRIRSAEEVYAMPAYLVEYEQQCREGRLIENVVNYPFIQWCVNQLQLNKHKHE